MIAMFSHRCLTCQRPWPATTRCTVCVYCGSDVVLVWEAGTDRPTGGDFYCSPCGAYKPADCGHVGSCRMDEAA